MVETGTIEQGKQDSYTFINKLGSGSYGDVWSASTSDGTKVAIKVYHPGISKKNMLTIKSELEVLQQISVVNKVCSKYAICLRDFYYTDGAPRIVTDLIVGMDLDTLQFKTTLQERQRYKKYLIPDLVNGMDAYHKLGITHQDLKEANIMWDFDSNTARYIDWGMGCLKKYCTKICKNGLAGGTGCGTSGTAYTMPPGAKFAQFNSKTFADARAHDIWSLGVILFNWFTFPKGQTAAIYYVNDPIFGPVLKKDSPPYWSEKQIAEKIATVDDPLVKTVLPLMLERDTNKRLSNWKAIIQLVKTGFTSTDQCDPKIDVKSQEPWSASNIKLDDILTISRGNDKFWCFRKQDIINDPSYDQQLGSFSNPYTGKTIILDREAKLDLKNWSENKPQRYIDQVLAEDNIEIAARNYLFNIVDLPNLLTNCSNTNWEQLQEMIIASKNGKTEYLLPFFWSLTNGDYNTNDPEKNLLVPISIDNYADVSWRFLFDTFSPTVVMASIFRFMELWIDSLIDAGKVAADQKTKLLCDYVTEFDQLMNDVNLLDVMQASLSNWNDIVKKKNLRGILKLIAKYANHAEKPFPLDWYMVNQNRKREFNKLGIQWARGRRC